MGSIKDKLNHLIVSKQAIHDMIEQRGAKIPQGTPFRDYPQYINKVSGGDVDLPPLSPWVRPAEWLTLPTPNNNEVYGLFLVSENTSVFENTLNVSISDAYRVDWGDGNIIDYALNELATHSYDFASISSPLTSDGKKQVIVKITPIGAGVFTSINFYVKPVGSTVMSYSAGMSDLKISASSLTSLQLRDHSNLHEFELVGTHSLTATNVMFYGCHKLKKVNAFDTSNVVTFESMFGLCYDLQEVPFFNTSKATNFFGFLSHCRSLRSIPHFDTSNVTNMQSAFTNCIGVKEFPSFDTSKAVTVQSMFSGCYSLVNAPELDLSSCLNTSFMLQNCISLLYVPTYNTSLVTNMRYMFQGCCTLPYVPPLDTSKVTDMSYFLSGCYNLTTLPTFDLTSTTNATSLFQSCFKIVDINIIGGNNITTASYMFASCNSLVNLPFFDTSNITVANAMINSCFALENIPNYDFSNLVTIEAMFQNSDGLKSIPTITSPFVSGGISTTWYSMELLEEIPPLNIANTTSSLINLIGCPSLKRIKLYNIPKSIDFQSSSLSREAIVEVFNNLLPTTGQYVNCKNNAGTWELTAEDIAIATNKGWTVITA